MVGNSCGSWLTCWRWGIHPISLYVNYDELLSYSINFIADSIYFNSIVLLTVWIVYFSKWDSIRLHLNISVSILKYSACHIWISLTRMSSPLRAPQDIYRMAILSIYIAFSVRNSSLTSWSPQAISQRGDIFFWLWVTTMFLRYYSRNLGRCILWETSFRRRRAWRKHLNIFIFNIFNLFNLHWWPFRWYQWGRGRWKFWVRNWRNRGSRMYRC